MKLEGLRDLDKALGALPGRMGQKVLVGALKYGAEPVAEAVQRLAPARPASAPDEKTEPAGVKRKRRPGTLKIRIGYGTKLTRRQRVKKADRDTAEVYVGTKDRAGVLDEFGTVRSKAQPFMRPGWEATKHQALDRTVSKLRDGVAEATAKETAKATAAARRASRRAAKGR